MKSLISVIIFSLTLTNCGFKPIYSSKNSNFEIIEILNKNENKNSFSIEKTLMSLSSKDASRKVKIEIDFINDANHNFTNHLEDLMDVIKKYLDQRYDNFIDTFHEENFI